MQDGSSGFKDTKQNTENPESQASSSEKLQQGLEKLASKVSELFADDIDSGTDSSDARPTDSRETGEENDSNEKKDQEKGDNNNTGFKDLFEKLFSNDFLENLKQANDVSEKNDSETSDEKDSDESEETTDNAEKKTRELTEEEKQELKDKLGWSDEKIKKCTIDEDGVIHYKTDRSDLEGKESENGVPYERKTIEINGVKIEGVFPVFDSVFDTELAPDNLTTKAYAKECNAKLKEAIEKDPELRSQFTEEQLNDIEEGRTPTGYVWHHNEEPGKMQLVQREDHDKVLGGAAHTGGNSLWGANSVAKKGVTF